MIECMQFDDSPDVQLYPGGSNWRRYAGEVADVLVHPDCNDEEVIRDMIDLSQRAPRTAGWKPFDSGAYGDVIRRGNFVLKIAGGSRGNRDKASGFGLTTLAVLEAVKQGLPRLATTWGCDIESVEVRAAVFPHAPSSSCTPVLATKYVEGDTLRSWQDYDPSSSLDLMDIVRRAVRSTSLRMFVDPDIHPKNIIQDPEGSKITIIDPRPVVGRYIALNAFLHLSETGSPDRVRFGFY